MFLESGLIKIQIGKENELTGLEKDTCTYLIIRNNEENFESISESGDNSDKDSIVKDIGIMHIVHKAKPLRENVKENSIYRNHDHLSTTMYLMYNGCLYVE